MTRKTPRKQANSRSQLRRPLTSNRARPAFRHRRLLGEWLENRLLLAAFARFDFQDTPEEPAPALWTKLLDGNDNLLNGALDPSGIGIQFESAIGVNGVGTTYAPSTVPSDITLIRNGFQRTGLSGDDPHMSFLLTNLDIQKSYEVWVLGGNITTGPTQTQRINVEGEQATSFDQTIASSHLWVNGAVGNSTMPLTNFAPIFVSAPFAFDLDNNDQTPANNVIRVTVTKSIGSTAAQVAGVAIREFELPTSFTLPSTGSPFSLLVEGGNRVVKNSGGTLLATLANTGAITINGTPAASDDLNISLSSGNPLTGGVTFNGGTGLGTSDKLTITGGSQGTVTYNYTNATDGSVVTNLGTVNYTGLEPITNTGTATDVIFNLPATSDFAFLEDNGATPADNMLRLRSAPTSFELTDFAAPGNSLTIDAAGGRDRISALKR